MWDAESVSTTIRRPSIPTVTVVALFLWASTAFTYWLCGLFACEAACSAGAIGESSLMAVVDQYALLIVFATGLILSLSSSIALMKRKRVTPRFVVLAVGVGVCLAAAASMLLRAEMGGVVESRGIECTIRIEQDSQVGAYKAVAIGLATFEDGGKLRVRVESSVDTLFRFGDVVDVRGDLVTPSDNLKERCWINGCAAVVSVKKTLRIVSRGEGLTQIPVSARNSICQTIDCLDATNVARSVLKAIVCGDKAGLTGIDVYDDFKLVGLAHVVAVSGAHLSIVCGLAMALLRRFGLPLRALVFFQMAILLNYLIASGMSVSAIRAAVMAACGLFSLIMGRRSSSLNALSLCVIVFIAFTPRVAVAVSFALSVASTLGIALFGGWAVEWVKRIMPMCPKLAVDAVSITGASALTSQFVSASLFSQLPLISPISNTLATPVFTVACVLGFVGSTLSLIVAPAGAFVLTMSAMAVQLLCDAVGLLSSVPFACLPVDIPISVALLVTVLMCFAVYWIWPLPNRATFREANDSNVDGLRAISQRLLKRRVAILAAASSALVIAICILSQLSASQHEIIMLDVGQGDAFLLRSGGATILIDTGTNDALLQKALARYGVYRLDAVVISHPDDDHCGSLQAISQVEQIGKICVAYDLLSCTCHSCDRLRRTSEEAVGSDNVVGLSVGDVVYCGAFELAVIWPDKYKDQGGNGDSLCFLCQADVDSDDEIEATVLFVGDAENEQLQKLIDQNRVGTVDIYKVGHHGSRSAITAEQALIIRPRISLVSVGASNRYGHPVEETLQSLVASGSTIYRTDNDGDVLCRISSAGITVYR